MKTNYDENQADLVPYQLDKGIIGFRFGSGGEWEGRAPARPVSA
jgi:hypothetical protein